MITDAIIDQGGYLLPEQAGATNPAPNLKITAICLGGYSLMRFEF
jgi:hypothetical protein